MGTVLGTVLARERSNLCIQEKTGMVHDVKKLFCFSVKEQVTTSD